MPTVAFIALFGDILVKLLLGPKWMMVVPIFRIFAVAAFVEPITNSIDVALMAYGRTKERFKLGAMNSFFFLCCVAVGSLWGTIGVTIGYSIAMYIALFISFVYGLKYTPVQIGSLLRILAPNCLISLFTFFVLFCVRRGAGWSLGAGWLVPFLLAGIVIYLGLWSIIPGGRDMLRGYMDKAANLMPRLKRS
jgi:PST family polysaccharide transporter